MANKRFPINRNCSLQRKKKLVYKREIKKEKIFSRKQEKFFFCIQLIIIPDVIVIKPQLVYCVKKH